MKKQMLFVGLIGLMLVLVAPCFAVDPLGAPRNYLEKGQFSFGVSASHSQQDLEIESYSWSLVNFCNMRISDFRTTKVYFEGAYAPSDSWSIFGRVGASEGQMGSSNEGEDAYIDHLSDGDYKPSFGAGVRFTVAENGNVSWGGVGQLGYTAVDFDKVPFEIYGCYNPNIQGEMNLFTAQLAFGPTVEINENVSVYCGGFLNWLSGDMDIEIDNFYSTTQSDKLNVREHSPIGVYAGGLVNIKGVKVAVDGNLLLSGGQGISGSIVIPF